MNAIERLARIQQINHFLRFFKDLEELALLDNDTENLRSEIEKMKKEIAGLQKEKETLQQQVKETITSDNVEYKEFKKDLDLKMNRLRSDFLQKAKENEAVLSELNLKIVNDEAKFVKETETRQAVLIDLDNQIKIKEATLIEINKKLATIKSKI